MREGSRRSILNGIGRPAQAVLAAAVVAAIAAAIAAGFAPVRAATSDTAPLRAGADSISAFRYFALYKSALRIEKRGGEFPWNDISSQSHVNDRLALLVSWRPWRPMQLFAKGATGYRLSEGHAEQFVLDEGHIAFDSPCGAIHARAFLDERVFWSGTKLSRYVSDESSFIDRCSARYLCYRPPVLYPCSRCNERRSEGLSVLVSPSPILAARYVESSLRDYDDMPLLGGLPRMRGGVDTYRFLRAELRPWSHTSGGIFLSQTRSMSYGDELLFESDLELRAWGGALRWENAQSIRGGWSDVNPRRLVGLSPGDAGAHDIGSFVSLSEEGAYAVEAEAPEVRSKRFGRLGLVGGYRFVGSAFLNAAGETTPGLRESTATAWWKHPSRALGVYVDAFDGFMPFRGNYRELAASIRARYKGGFEAKPALLLREGEGVGGSCSFASEQGSTRFVMTARVDDIGGRSSFAFVGEGDLRLARRFTVRSTLYRAREARSLYNLAFEFRPNERFLLSAAAGTFAPGIQGIGWDRASSLPGAIEERAVAIVTRVWLGEREVR